jgi:hypothetical protein
LILNRKLKCFWAASEALTRSLIRRNADITLKKYIIYGIWDTHFGSGFLLLFWKFPQHSGHYSTSRRNLWGRALLARLFCFVFRFKTRGLAKKNQIEEIFKTFEMNICFDQRIDSTEHVFPTGKLTSCWEKKTRIF